MSKMKKSTLLLFIHIKPQYYTCDYSRVQIFERNLQEGFCPPPPHTHTVWFQVYEFLIYKFMLSWINFVESFEKFQYEVGKHSYIIPIIITVK